MDFANDNIGTLFRKMFMPTLLGMLSMVVLNLADGAFVGHGAGTEALAAINIAAPIFDIMIGIGIMFGIGASVISSIHLSKGDVKAARINSTQSLIGSFIVTAILGAIILLNLDDTCRLFGSSESLVPLAGSYLRWVALSLPFCIIGNVGAFVVRLDGSPKFSMMCTLLACALNIFLDWLFIFPLGLGLKGAALATSIGGTTGVLMTAVYMLHNCRTLRFYRLKATLTSLLLTLRNIWYMVKIGFSSFIGQLSVSVLVLCANYRFMALLGEDGVTAYGVCCYIVPVVMMVFYSICQSAQPIISFNYGGGNEARVRKTYRLSVLFSVSAGLLFALLTAFFAEASDQGQSAADAFVQYVMAATVGKELSTGADAINFLGDTVDSFLRDYSPDAAIAAVLRREESMPTGLDHGIAVPHGRSSEVTGIAGAVAVLDNEGTANGCIPDYETIDNSPLSIIVLTLANDTEQTPYLQLMSFISRALRTGEGYSKLIACKTTDEMKAFFRNVK